MTYDFLIVGAGFSGCVLAERIATQLGRKVMIIDRRDHIGGNCYDYPGKGNILIHKYGPHIFHTSSGKVWQYLSRFTGWFPYEHKVLASIEGMKVPVPFNFNSMDMLFPAEYSSNLQQKLLQSYAPGVKIPILKLLESKDEDIRNLAKYIYDKVFYGYTLKQWGLTPEELDFSVTSRVPVLLGRDDRYFQDAYQGIPVNGYTELFKKLIENKKIELLLNTDFKQYSSIIKYKKLIFTGPIDEFFDYSYGRLPYRSLRFGLKYFDKEFFQETAQVNYPNDNDFTRITEFKYFSDVKSAQTVVAYEYPEEYAPGQNEPYYPVPMEENQELFTKYSSEAGKISDKVLFTGRLADYKYYNMDQTVGMALMLFEKKIATR